MSDTDRHGIQRQVETVSAEMLKDRLARIADSLRRIADATDRAMLDVDRVTESARSNYGYVVGTVQHTVLWGLANLSLDALVSLAGDADAARLTQRVREGIAEGIDA